METRNRPQPYHEKRISVLVIKSLARRIRELPISFYLILAIIAALLLGVTGFVNLDDPRRLAFTLTLFVVFFGAVSYRAMVDAIDIYRDYHRKHSALLSDVMQRDGFAEELRERTQAAEPSNASKSES